MTAGDLAHQLTDLILSECAHLDADGRRIVANQIIDAIQSWSSRTWTTKGSKTNQEPLVPMTDTESLAFGQCCVPFGAFQGRTWNDVPLDRMAWYADTARENWRNLWRYLHSERVKREEASDG